MPFRVACMSLLAACGSFTEVKAQSDVTFDPYAREPLPIGAPAWMREIADDPAGVSYHKMDSLFNYWLATDINARVKTLDRKPAVNFYRRWMKAYRPYVGTDGYIHLPTMQEHIDRLERQNRRTASLPVTRAAGARQWRNIGPNTTKGKNNKPKDSQACVYRLAVSPQNPDILYCGTEMGVVFKTTDKGKNWKPCNALHNFGGPIFALQADPNNANIVYAGGGQNLWKSIDGGQSWTLQHGIVGRVNSIRISPENSQHLTICTGIIKGEVGGFYTSTDGGRSYQLRFRGVCHDHELQPGNPRRVYMLAKPSEGDEFLMYVSDDEGAVFRQVTLPVSNVVAGRLAVSEAPGGKDYVYALVNASYMGMEYGPYGGQGQPHILKSTDAGNTWVDQTERTTYKATFSPFVDESQGGQGYFDMIVGASALNPEHVIFGLCSSYRSLEGGKGWYRETAIGGYQKQEGMHPDMQDIAVCGNDTWICTDGGIKYSADFFATPGEDRYFGIYASEYVGFGQGWNEDVMVGGRWHNGNAVMTERYGEGNSLYVSGVEQSTGHVMLSDNNKAFFSDGGMTVIPRNISDPVETTYQHFKKRPMESLRTSKELGFDPRYAQRLVMASVDAPEDYYKLFLSEDEGLSFREIIDTDGEFISCYEFSRSNPDHIYVVCAYTIRHSTDNGKTWKEFPSLPFDRGDNMGGASIAVDPHDENTLWFTNCNYPGQVAYTTDCGVTWNYPLESSPAMKDKKFNWVVLAGNEQHGVYLNTIEESFIFYKDDGTNGWIDYSAGFPPGARITRLVPFYKEGKLRAATSQGLWEIPLYRESFIPVAQPMALNIGNADISATPNKEILFDSYSIVNQKDAQWEWTFSPKPQRVTGAKTRNPRVVFGNNGSYDVTLKVTTPQGSHSKTIRDMVRINTPSAIEQPTTPEVPVEIRYENGTPRLVLLTGKLRERKTLTLHDVKGALLYQAVIPAGETMTEVNLRQWKEGIYIYRLTTDHHKYYGKFLKK
ncbi:MAG: hypothetical protein K6A82_09495 [Prevotella sp.]|nr:hypothetical protein [Prevotella sp.]